ncbi:MAG: amidohydrolase family protein, partial [Bacteroidota bacterium]|nr:amidohydrolase family protein [Bacteroidota bacterium]
HTFIEIADFFNEEKGIESINFAKIIKDNFEHSSLAAHSPYTCSPNFIEKTADESKIVYSIHNQETKHEDLMYLNGKSKILDLIKKRKYTGNFQKTAKSSLKSYLPKIRKNDLNIILVHNLFTNEEDIIFAEKENTNLFWCICSNSNYFIQEKRPQIDRFVKNNAKICLGTDSLASNNSLSIIDEMKNFTDYNFIDVLKWATINGAKALKIDDVFGSIEIGKQPGLNLITKFDFENFHLTSNSRIKVLI